MIPTGPRPFRSARGPSRCGPLAVVIAAVVARAWLLWSTALVPGMNGGYYPVQARALLEHSGLGFPDLPLTFLLQAGFVKFLHLVI